MSDWPAQVFDAPVLRGLDLSAREAIVAAGRIVALADGETVYRASDPGDSFYVVVSGEVVLSAVRRGDDEESVVRVARRGDTFGEEATMPGAARRMTAATDEKARVAEIPIAVLRRVLGRGGGDLAERERRMLERAATRDLLGTLAFTRDLSDDDADIVLDAAQHRTFGRGERIYSVGEEPDAFYLIIDGLVQLQTTDGDRIHVRAYLTRGDFFGDDELLTSEPRRAAAVAMGECHALRLPDHVVRTLSDRNPGLLGRIRRIAADRRELQADVVGEAASRSTQHVFKDLYRMQMARSMLVIDQDTCVRCGHCAWACSELYGASRLVRRGDKVVTSLGDDASSVAAPRNLSLPNTCQHCRNPACMIDCPTGAIGRDPEGEVFIREDLCTGCGNCAKACPWENIRMAQRPAGDAPVPDERPSGVGQSSVVAVKCDLCRDYEAPACVQACPTESIFRLEPAEDFSEVSRLFGSGGGRAAASTEDRVATWAIGASVAVSTALGAAGWTLQQAGVWVPSSGGGLIAGWLAGTALVVLAGYSAPKRLVKLWMRRREKSATRRSAEALEGGSSPRVRSRVRPHAVVHTAVGLAAIGAVLAHAGARFPATPAGALHVAFWLTALLGVLGAVAYRAVPGRLARLERSAALPEDLAREREQLFDRLYRDASGKSELVKKIVEKVLAPYARSALGPVALVLSGRTLREEQERVREDVDGMLEGRGGDRLAGLDDLVRTVVDLRALPARRVLTAALRLWLPAHVVLTGLVLAGLVLHVWAGLRL